MKDIPASLLYKKIRRYLKNQDHIVLGIYRGYHGYYEDGRLYINIDREIIPTLIHEYCHHLYPDAPERDIRKLETRYKRELSVTQKIKLMRML